MPNTHNRVGIAGTIYHQVPGHNPTSASLRCSMPLKMEREEAYSRSPPKPVGSEWQPLDLGWIGGKCSVLCIRNLESEAGLGIEIGADGYPDKLTPQVLTLAIPPGMATVLYPFNESIAIRCPGGEAHYTIFAVPE